MPPSPREVVRRAGESVDSPHTPTGGHSTADPSGIKNAAAIASRRSLANNRFPMFQTVTIFVKYRNNTFTNKKNTSIMVMWNCVGTSRTPGG